MIDVVLAVVAAALLTFGIFIGVVAVTLLGEQRSNRSAMRRLADDVDRIADRRKDQREEEAS